MMDRRAFVVAGMATLAAPRAAQAQQDGKIRRVGWLNPASDAAAAEYRKAFLEGLRDVGWIEGQNILIQARHAEGKEERLPGLAAELVSLKVDVILTSTTAIPATKRATSTIPIVMAISINPVEQGLISSLRQPGGNITGLAWSPTPAISGKYLEFLKEILPGLQRVGGIIDPSNRGILAYRQAAEGTASKLGLTLQHIDVRIPKDFEEAFAAIAGSRAQAVLIYGSPFVFGHLPQIVELAAKHGLPATYPYREAVAMNGLMSYGVDQADLFRRAAAYVNRILRGTKPADLPVEEPTKFMLAVNLKTAKALGLTIPPSLLARADQVIE